MTIRVFREVIVVMILVAGTSPGCATQTKAPPSAAPPTTRAARDTVRRLNLQVEKLYGEGLYEEAVAVAERARVLGEDALGPSDPDLAESLNNLAAIYVVQGHYAKAEPLCLRALAIREHARGPTHPDVAESLNNLATLYWELGEYAKAESSFVRAVEIVERLDPGHPLGARVVSNLALLLREQGAYAKAESLLLRARDVRERTLGRRHPLVAQILNSLAAIYHRQGAYAEAETLYIEARDILEKTVGTQHADFASYSSNLATLYRDQGAYAMAEPLYLGAIDTFARVLGEAHPRRAGSLTNLAMLYREQGAYAKAEDALVKALDVRTRALGRAHPDVANSLNNLATLYRERGRYAEAEPLYLRALEIREAQLGRGHPEVASTLIGLAELYWAQGAYDQAEPRLARAAEIREQQLRTEFAQLPEPRKRAMMALLAQETDTVVSFHADFAPASASALALAFTTILRRKVRVLGSQIDSEMSLGSDVTPLLGAQVDQLIQSRSELVAQRYASGRGDDAAHRRGAAAAQARVTALESRLGAASPDVRAQLEPVTLAKIQAALPVGTALVEVVRYQHRDAGQPRQSRRGTYYAAYLLTARGSPRFVALGGATLVDDAIDAVTAAMSGRASSAGARGALRRLDALVLAPIRARLPGISHLILAPDGKLNLVSFEALVDAENHYAVENYLISYITTGRDLLRFTMPPRPPRSPAILVAAPDYGAWLPPGPDVMRFGPLPGADGEAKDLQRYFPTAPVMSGMATKSALAALAGPALLHIATHGFYAQNAGPGVRSGGPEVLARTATLRAQDDTTRGMIVDGGSLSQPRSHFDAMAYALDHSGLAMAGANHGATGIVTAREIAAFDWRGTQLVVLSACGTGVGALSSGEGVYGLRRALVLAGSASQVVSLWSVDDEATRMLMREYYGDLVRGIGRAEALRQAKLRVLHLPFYSQPYYWAAFIAAGDWRALTPGTILDRSGQDGIASQTCSSARRFCHGAR